MSEAINGITQGGSFESTEAALVRRQEEFDRLVRRYHSEARLQCCCYRMTGNHSDAEELDLGGVCSCVSLFWQLSARLAVRQLAV